MREPKPEILTALSVQIANVILYCRIDEQKKTARVMQEGETLNGDGNAIAKAAELLRGRLMRVRPELKVQ